jgi:hypothetical protein
MSRRKNIGTLWGQIRGKRGGRRPAWRRARPALEELECRVTLSVSGTISPVGINVDGGDALFANMVNGGTRAYWWAAGNTRVTVPTDSNLWPESDAEIFLGEGDTTTEAGGSYLVQFNGEATVTNWPQNVDWLVNGTDLHSSTLQVGQGYNSRTNTTTATMVVTPSANAGFYMSFTNTSRNPNLPGNIGNGITNLYVMQPSSLGGSTPIPVGTLFTPSAISMFEQYAVLRASTGLDEANGSLASSWSDRTLVSDNFWSGYTFDGNGIGVDTNVSTPWSGSPLDGVP